MLRSRPLVSILVIVIVAGVASIATLGFAQLPGPRPEHTTLLDDVGEWEGTQTFHLPGLPNDPIPAKQKVIAIGDFWIQAHFESEIVDLPYVGTGCLGYDPRTKKYVGTWVDSMGAHMAIMEGERRKDGTLVMRWQAPGFDGRLLPHRYERVRDGDRITSTYYVNEDTKFMTISLKRKKRWR